MKKPALNKEKASKNLLKAPAKRKRSVNDSQLATPGNELVLKSNAYLQAPKAPKEKAKIHLAPFMGVFFAVFTVLYVLSLVSYSPADPSFTHAAPLANAKNFVGGFGAYLSDISLFVFGWSAYWLIGVGAMVAWRYASSHYVKTPFGRIYHLTGLILLLCASTTLEALRLYPYAERLPGEAGGILGQALTTAVVPYMGAIGVTLIMLVLGAWGMAIFFDFSWLNVFEGLGARVERLYKRDNRREEIVKADFNEPEKKKEVITSSLPFFKKEDKVEEKEDDQPGLAIDIKPQAKVEQSTIALQSQQESLFENSVTPIRPDLRLFDPAVNSQPSIDKTSLSIMSNLIESKLASYGVKVTVRAANPGPVVTRYEIEPAEGVKSSAIKNLENDLARVLSVQSVRVLETVPNTPYMGLEVPNPKRQIVKLSKLLGSQDFARFKGALPLCLGKCITGEPFVQDLAKMPHLLVAGTTGSGKSVGVNSMILSLLYRFEPSKLRLILIDPKKVEFSWYEDIPHLLCPVVDQMNLAKHSLQWCVKEMDRRYHLAHLLKVRNIDTYNQKVRELAASGTTMLSHYLKDVKEDMPLEELPYIVVVVDEMADLLMVDKKGVEDSLIRLAQKARAAGIHLILATQRPSADVLSGLLRTNIPSRAAFQVATGSDSRIILDQMGAENLLGNGDFLFKMPSLQSLERVQGAFVTDGELERITSALRQMAKPKYVTEVLVTDEDEEGEGGENRRSLGGARDALFDKAVQIILDSNKCSVTFLQRRLGVGYPRAANIVDELEAEGIVSAADSSGRRTINARPDQLEL